MSIINEALKKADYFKKWKGATRPSFSGFSDASSSVAVKELPRETSTQQVTPVPSTIPVPPFQIHFNQPEAKIKRVPPLLTLTQVMLVTCGFLIFLFGLWFLLWLGQNLRSEKTSLTNQSLAPLTVIEPRKISEKVSSAAHQSLPPSSTLGRQPSVRPIPRTVVRPGLVYKLTGISILNEKERFAFINDKMVELGGGIGDAQVISIKDKEVVLRRGDKEFTLFLE